MPGNRVLLSYIYYFYYIFILGAYNNAGLVPLANVIAPGVPPPPPYTPNPGGTGKVMLLWGIKSE
jgi:hypothetical protein